MKLLLGTLIALLGVLLLGYGLKPVRLQTYLLPSTLKHGWVIIEYENPKCPRLREGRLWQEHVIPESRYLCTSSHSEENLTYQRYYLVDAQGRRNRLGIDKQIFQRRSLQLSPSNNACRITVEEFWYGPKDLIDNEDAAIVEKYHPECVTRLETPIK
ncbi:MAG TPA: hypothetical protein VGO56_22600 [Pyrinomonadaceae bacterium]|jgi:hypothetical protein|nr:hypothetical protein [Pyrinomonadaceae bacterium]